MYNLNPRSALTKPPPGVFMPDLDALAARICEHRCFLFAGAGISVDSGLVGWKDLMASLYALAKTEGASRDDLAYINDFLTRGDYITAAELLQRSLRSNDKLILSQTLQAARTTTSGRRPRPNPLHFLLTRIGFANLVTTNYDSLLEEASHTFKLPGYKTTSWRGADELRKASPADRYIIKLHGSVSDSPDSVVISRSGYLEAYKDGAYINTWLRAALSFNSFLFIGYSLNDYDLLSLVREARTSLGPASRIGPHFAILPAASVPDVHADYLRHCYGIESIRIEVTSANVRSLLVALHGEVAWRQVQSANFTVLPGSHFAMAIRTLWDKIEQAMAADHVSLYMVEELDSHRLRQWKPDTASYDARVPPAISDLFLQMRDVNYLYLADTQASDEFHVRRMFAPDHSAAESLVVLPVASQGKKWGLVVLSSRIPGCLTENHLNALGAIAKSIADTYIECTKKISAVSHVADNLTFDFVRRFLNSSRIVANASAANELDYILYTIDYLRGELTAHCDPRYLGRIGQFPELMSREGKLRLPFEGKYLAVKAINQGTGLRYEHREAAKLANPDYEKGIDAGFGLFDIKGNVCVSPVRSFGYISAILAAWNKQPCTDGVFHSTVFDRVKRLVRVFMNDPSRYECKDPDVAASHFFITALDTALAVIDGGTRWGSRVDDPSFQEAIIETILRLLTHSSTRFMKVRLWVLKKPPRNYPERDADLAKVKFRLHSSFAHRKAIFSSLPEVNGYTGAETVAGDQYTQYTMRRFRSDPYARFHKGGDFTSADSNAELLHKDPDGIWVTGPVVWREKGGTLADYLAGTNARLLGFVTADSHCNDGGSPRQAFLGPAQRDYQRCVIDLATHLLAPIVRAIVIRTRRHEVPKGCAGGAVGNREEVQGVH